MARRKTKAQLEKEITHLFLTSLASAIVIIILSVLLSRCKDHAREVGSVTTGISGSTFVPSDEMKPEPPNEDNYYKPDWFRERPRRGKI